jgi:hypothetical protein
MTEPSPLLIDVPGGRSLHIWHVLRDCAVRAIPVAAVGHVRPTRWVVRLDSKNWNLVTSVCLRSSTTSSRLTSELTGYEHRADNMRMVKRLLRDLLGKRTERKALNPEVRTMLESLDGVYEPKSSGTAATRDSSADRTRQDSR